MKATVHFRQVRRRTLVTSKEYVSTLVLQQWWSAEPWEHPDYRNTKGKWRDVPIVTEEGDFSSPIEYSSQEEANKAISDWVENGDKK